MSNTLEQNSPAYTELLAEGKYVPTAEELRDALEVLNLREELKGATAVGTDKDVTFSFPTPRGMRLFGLAVCSKGVENGLYVNTPGESFYESTKPQNFRIDGGQFALNETITPDRNEVRFYVGYADKYDPERLKAYKGTINQTVSNYLEIEPPEFELN